MKKKQIVITAAGIIAILCVGCLALALLTDTTPALEATATTATEATEPPAPMDTPTPTATWTQIPPFPTGTATATPTATPQIAPTQPPVVECPYVGNRNSKKFHHYWCSSVGDMKEENKVCLQSREEAMASGYVPCKRCNP